tara:strand:+ start:405 stop:563 length:159 start_codon:yes stop_codon:yes gene_type:complete
MGIAPFPIMQIIAPYNSPVCNEIRAANICRFYFLLLRKEVKKVGKKLNHFSN